MVRPSGLVFTGSLGSVEHSHRQVFASQGFPALMSGISQRLIRINMGSPGLVPGWKLNDFSVLDQ